MCIRYRDLVGRECAFKKSTEKNQRDSNWVESVSRPNRKRVGFRCTDRIQKRSQTRRADQGYRIHHTGVEIQYQTAC